MASGEFTLIQEVAKAVRPPIHLLQNDDEGDEVFISLIQSIIASFRGIPRVRMSDFVNTVRSFSDSTFLLHFRVQRSVAYWLIEEFQESSVYKSLSVTGRVPLSAEHHVLTMLWFVGHEAQRYRDVARRFGVNLNTLFNILSRVINFLISFAPQVIKLPSDEEKTLTENYFKNETGLSGIIGVMGDTHVRISRLATIEDPCSYLNEKKDFSVHLQAIVNHERKFMHVFVGYPGSAQHSEVLNESGVLDLLPTICEGGYYLVGDGTYPSLTCLPQMIVPYQDYSHLTNAEHVFNENLSRCCSTVKDSFRELKQRFCFLHHCRFKTLVRIVKIVYACCVLHNVTSSEDLACLNDDDELVRSKESVKRQKNSDENQSGVSEVSNGD